MDGRTAAPRDPRPAAQRVRDAAKDLFYRQGIHATGVEEVCRVAGTTKMGLYRTYPSKDALVEAVLREDCEAGEAVYAQTMALPDPRDRPWHYLETAVGLLRNPGFRCCPMGMVTVEFPDVAHPARRLVDAHRQVKRQRLRQLCAEAGATAPDILGDSLLLLLEGAFGAAPYLGNQEAATALQAAAGQLLAAGLPQGARPDR